MQIANHIEHVTVDRIMLDAQKLHCTSVQCTLSGIHRLLDLQSFSCKIIT